MFNLTLKNSRTVSSRGFTLYNHKLTVMPVRRAIPKIDASKIFTRQNIDSAIGAISAATGVASSIQVWREKNRIANEAREAARASSEGWKESIQVDTSFKPHHWVKDVQDGKDLSPTSGPGPGPYMASPHELELRVGDELSFMDGLLPDIDSRYLALATAILLLIPIIINAVRLNLVNRLLDKVDTRRALLNTQSEIASYLKRVIAGISIGTASAVVAELISIAVEEYCGYEFDAFEFLGVLLCAAVAVSTCAVLLHKLLKKNEA